MRQQTHLLIVVITHICLLNHATRSCRTWKIPKSSGQGVPVEWLATLLGNMNADLKKQPKKMQVPALVFGVYIWFLLEDVFPLMRYNLANRQSQLEMTRAKNDVDQFFKNLGVSLGKNLSWAINLTLVQEDDYRTATFLFSQPVEDFKALKIPALMASLMDQDYDYDTMVTEDKMGKTWAMNAFEMVHFVFQLGYHNAGLDFEFESDPTVPDPMANTVAIAHAIFDACMNRHPDAMKDGLMMFGTVLQDIYGSAETVNGEKIKLLEPGRYMGNNVDEKTENMYNFLHDSLFYYVGWQESLSFMDRWYNNPALEQFLIKGGVMLTVGIAKHYLMPGIDVGDVGNSTVSSTMNIILESAADQAVDQVIDHLDVASMVATQQQTDLGLNKTNIIDNAVAAFGERYIAKNYVIIDKRFTMYSQNKGGNAPTGQRQIMRDRILTGEYRRLI